jgi:hypothetical protein
MIPLGRKLNKIKAGKCKVKHNGKRILSWWESNCIASKSKSLQEARRDIVKEIAGIINENK